MRIAAASRHAPTLDSELPIWPPLLATRGKGARSTAHAHHAMHLVLALAGELSVRVGRSHERGAGVLTAPDVAHALDAEGVEVLLVFLDPESEVGASLRAAMAEPIRILSAEERDHVLDAGSDPMRIMQAGGLEWTRRAVAALGGERILAERTMHPRVKKLLKRLRTMGPETDTSLEALAAAVGLSPGRLMHAFSESIGVPLRPYLAWLKLQRAAAAIVTGLPLTQAAHAAGFSDSAHMTRTFRRMLGMSPSALRP